MKKILILITMVMALAVMGCKEKPAESTVPTDGAITSASVTPEAITTLSDITTPEAITTTSVTTPASL